MLIPALLFLVTSLHAIPPAECATLYSPNSEFSGSKAFEHIEKLTATGKRFAGSQNEKETARYIYETMLECGITATIQEFNVDTGDNKFRSCNVIGVKKGSSRQTICLTAHYDSVGGVGAVDNASGVGVLLELARVLAAFGCRESLIFVAFGAEETGLHGSRYYISTLEECVKDDIVAAVNIDTVGFGQRFEPGYVAEGAKLKQTPFWLLRKVYGISKDMDLDTEMYISAVNGHHLGRKLYGYCNGQHRSDHIAFLEKGIPAVSISFGPALYSDQGGFLHSESDTPDKVSKQNLKLAGEIAVSLIEKITNITPVPLQGAGNLGERYFIAEHEGELYGMKYVIGVALAVSSGAAALIIVLLLIKALKRAG